jgi:RNA polymerase sigma-70 factor (ECF subfamily)
MEREKEILKRVKEGDQKAFEELYNKYADYALRVAAAITRSDTSAADAVQETFIRVYHYIVDFDLDKPFQPWFYRILINECNRLMKKKAKTISISDYLENDMDFAKDDVHEFEEYEALYKAIGRLEDINRIPIVLKYLKGFTETEIAEILAINQNTVKSRLYKGRQKLKNYMEKFTERRSRNG